MKYAIITSIALAFTAIIWTVTSMISDHRSFRSACESSGKVHIARNICITQRDALKLIYIAAQQRQAR